MISQTGFSPAAPAGGEENLTITTGQNSAGNNFGFLPSSISGVVFDDTNDNGVLDPGESPTEGVVWDDLDNSGVYNPSVSQYTVNSLNVPQAVSGMSTILSSAIADDLSGTITDVGVNLTIDDGSDANLSVTLIGPNGTRVNLLNHNGGTGTNFVNTTLDDEASTAITSGRQPFTGSFKPASSLSTFNGENPNGTWELLVVDTAASDSGTLVNWSLQFTTNAAEPFVETSDGYYQLTNLPAGMNTIREYLFTDVAETSPPGGAYDVDITSQTTITGANFGNHAASVSGTVFLDANQDGNLDPGDPGLGGWLVYDDENDDGAFDQPVESNIAALDDPQPITPQSTTTSDISVSGQNGPIDDAVVTLSLDYPSDADLVITLTDPSGTTITLDNGVMTGQNMINTTFEDGGTALTAGAAPYTGTFQPSDLLASLDGDDPDGVWQLQVTDNGQTDSGTLEGWNLQLAAGNTDEPSAVTAADGSYQLNNLPEGVNIIREVPPAGYAETSPAGGFAAVTLTTGSYVTGINFGIDTAPPVVESAAHRGA